MGGVKAYFWTPGFKQSIHLENERGMNMAYMMLSILAFLVCPLVAAVFDSPTRLERATDVISPLRYKSKATWYSEDGDGPFDYCENSTEYQCKWEDHVVNASGCTDSAESAFRHFLIATPAGVGPFIPTLVETTRSFVQCNSKKCNLKTQKFVKAAGLHGGFQFKVRPGLPDWSHLHLQ